MPSQRTRKHWRHIDPAQSQAKDKANTLRKKLGLNWDQVKFKSERKSSSGGQKGGSRIDYARNYNPSKGRRFRGVFHPDGSYGDID